ncbi:uncharacterized protein LOC132637063 [Lycium barbarum]|uniref:uncharacterized protein LOC132637063 n=1 Tax=Lycium barbarum TaxID=112863 RepID=UPI00293E4A38|nr:uncharacterized protein LOC132637063 [Lycium barbarum]
MHIGANDLGQNGISSEKFRIHSTSSPFMSKAMNLDSIVEREIQVCLGDFQDNAPPPMIKTYPLVDFISVDLAVSALVPNLSFKYSEEVRMAAVPAMQLLLYSAACAMNKGLPITGCDKSPVKEISNTIITDLLDGLKKESNIQIQARLLEAFDKSIQILGSHLSKHQAAKFLDGISKALSTCSYDITEREKRVKARNDLREQELLKEEAKQQLTICRKIGICLGTMVKKLKPSFLPLLDKFLPNVSLMWSKDRTSDERRIPVHLFCDIAEKYYEDWTPLLPRVYYHKNPDVPQIVATVIGICAEYGADFLKPYTTVISDHLKTVMEHPNAKHLDNITAYEAAVSTCGKLIQPTINFLVFDDLRNCFTWQFILLWLSHLPTRCNLDEAKISHELLCSMMETSEQKVIGPDGSYIPNMITLFAEVLWAGNNLATDETTSGIIKLF